jgi:hypothetical protein
MAAERTLKEEAKLYGFNVGIWCCRKLIKPPRRGIKPYYGADAYMTAGV